MLINIFWQYVININNELAKKKEVKIIKPCSIKKIQKDHGIRIVNFSELSNLSHTKNVNKSEVDTETLDGDAISSRGTSFHTKLIHHQQSKFEVNTIVTRDLSAAPQTTECYETE